MLTRVSENMKDRPRYVFIASDQQDLIHELKASISTRNPSMQCVWREQIKRSLDGSPLHLQQDLRGEERYLLGKDALVDSLIMSRSVALIRTASYLSAWCSIWNPILPVYMVNAPHASKCWFPDNEILISTRFYMNKLKSIRNET